MSEDAPQTCEHCHWFRRGTIEERGKLVRAYNGHCMHSPPTATGKAGMGKWPIVNPTHWCGQWQERATE